MRCIWRHDYGKWSEPYETEVVVLGDFGRASDSPRVYQDRVCRKCKRVDTRFIRKGRLPVERAEYDG